MVGHLAKIVSEVDRYLWVEVLGRWVLNRVVMVHGGKVPDIGKSCLKTDRY